MFKYLSKFFLEIMPPVVATVIGAFIVTHYINPSPKMPAPAQEANAPEQRALVAGSDAAADKAGRADVATLPAAKPKAAEPAEVRKISLSREKSSLDRSAADKAQAEKASLKSQPPAASGGDSRDVRDVNDIARAALERARLLDLDRSRAETPSADIARAEPSTRPTAVAPQSVAARPAVSELPAMIVPPPPEVARPVGDRRVDAARPVPPAEIPQTLEARSTAQWDADDPGSVADGVISATRSLLRAVIPH